MKDFRANKNSSETMITRNENGNLLRYKLRDVLEESLSLNDAIVRHARAVRAIRSRTVMDLYCYRLYSNNVPDRS